MGVCILPSCASSVRSLSLLSPTLTASPSALSQTRCWLQWQLARTGHDPAGVGLGRMYWSSECAGFG